MAEALKKDWVKIEKEAISGVPLPKLAEKYGIKYMTLFMRAKRNNWATADAVRSEASKIRMANKDIIRQSAMSLIEKGEDLSMHAMNLVHGAVTGMEEAPHIASVGDFAAMVQLGRKIAGMDKEQVNVNVANFWAMSPDDERPEPIDV